MKKFFLLFALCIVSIGMSAQSPQDKQPIDSNVRYGKLPNGLTYYIRHNAQPENRADFYIAQKVGSMQEEDPQAGLAHFLEHMAFNGTKHFPGRKTMLNYLESNGVQFGSNVNAYTSFDETVYNLSDVPVMREGLVDSCLLVLHDWSSFISLENADIDKERAIIEEEWRSRSGAQTRIWDKTLPILFKGSKYANRMPIGDINIIRNFKHQTIKDYYHKWYRPDLQAIIIVGDIDVDKIEAKVKKMFADIPAPVNPAERVYFPVADNVEPLVAIASDPEATSTNVTVYLKHDVLPDEVKLSNSGLAIGYLTSVASSMLSARYSEMAQKADAPFNYAYAYDGGFFVARTKDAWTLGAGCKEDKVKDALAALIRENERVKQFGFTAAEYDRAKASLLKSVENSYNNRDKQKNSAYSDEYVRSFTQTEAIPGIEYEYNMMKILAEQIPVEAVNQFMAQLINTDKNVVITVTGPEKEGLVYPTEADLINVFKEVEAEKLEAYAETLSDEPLMPNLPKAGKIVKETKDAKFGTTVWTLSNGAQVVLKKTDFKNDEIRMSATALGGTALYPDKDIQTIAFASSVPSVGGLGNFSAVDLRKVLAGKTASANPYIGSYTKGMSGSSSIKDLETLFQLTYLNFTQPRKDEEAYKAFTERVKTQLRNAQANPYTAFSDSISNVLYSYSPRVKRTTVEDVDNLNYDRIISMYKENFSDAGSFIFTFVGSLDEATMRPFVEQYIAALPAVKPKTSAKENVMMFRKGNVNCHFQKEMQNPKATVLDMYSGTLKRDLKTELSFEAMKQILDLIYTAKVRLEQGGTYGVSVSGNIARKPEGQSILQINFETEDEKVKHLNEIIHKEFAAFAQTGGDNADFQKAKEYMNKQFQQDIKENGYWVGVLNTYYMYKEDDHTDYQKTLDALTKEDVKAVAAELLKQKNIVEIIMLPKK
ncbi:zinc protease [Dysgonomonas sp. PH5-45]|uniref:M16 family metallopeptidase n=1 Tax=unclassified Dysgonomonas TaxID=2630389 RepID=UPI0024766101|nr:MULTISPECIES: M16 family metallopeptidase [unclassified Dysgonomonas]MDH6355790.1 zinc protease [Dysgonomonas sp. PH5-45]MDH6388688.1 zinc protease [Dysgonomonas sp. PH5-37]